jgi:hypothetical protein
MPKNNKFEGLPMPAISNKFKIISKVDIKNVIAKNATGINVDLMNNSFKIDLALFPNDEDFLDLMLHLYYTKTKVSPTKETLHIPMGDITIEFLDGGGSISGALKLLKSNLFMFGIDFKYVRSTQLQPITLKGEFNDILFLRKTHE